MTLVTRWLVAAGALLGGILLAFVNVRIGEQAAREAERRLVADGKR